MSDASVAPPIQIKAPSPGKYRWIIMWLLFAAMVINYVDRQAIGVLKPTLMEEFGWTETNYADIIFWFQASYAVSIEDFADEVVAWLDQLAGPMDAAALRASSGMPSAR